MKKVFSLLLFLMVAFLGFRMGEKPLLRKEQPVREFPVAEQKSFALVVYAYNDAPWCERALRSIFEQDYDSYRILFIDDGSCDGTFEKAHSFILENKQESRVILIRNQAVLGPVGSLYRALDNLSDKEIAIPLNAKDWFAHPQALQRLNHAYQDPDLWLAFSSSIDYPSYEMSDRAEMPSFYAALFRQIRLIDLLQNGRFAESRNAYLQPLRDLAGSRAHSLPEPLIFSNQTRPKIEQRRASITTYHSLEAFPKSLAAKERTDLLLFSFDRPLQLYACLESIQRYFSGLEKISVIYRTSSPAFAAGYQKVAAAFPSIHFIQQSETPKKDFKPSVLKTLFDSSSKYILFGVDDIIAKDFTDLNLCMEMMEKTGAYGFYFRFGKHISYCYQSGQPQSVPASVPLGHNIYAWDLNGSQFDWGFPTSLDMTLYRKSDLKEAFEKMKYKTPNSLEFTWAKEHWPKEAIGLYFELSKIVNIPLNIVSPTGNPHMNAFSTEELLGKFEQGLKIDIDPLYRIENCSPHFEYFPEFVNR